MYKNIIFLILGTLTLGACSSRVDVAAKYIECRVAAEGLQQDDARASAEEAFNRDIMRNDKKAIVAEEYIDAVYLAMGKIANKNSGNDKATYLKIYNSKFCQNMHTKGELKDEDVGDIIPLSKIPLPKRD